MNKKEAQEQVDVALNAGASAAIVIDSVGYGAYGGTITKAALAAYLLRLSHYLLNETEHEQRLVQELRAKLAEPGAVQRLVAGPDEPVE